VAGRGSFDDSDPLDLELNQIDRLRSRLLVSLGLQTSRIDLVCLDQGVPDGLGTRDRDVLVLGVRLDPQLEIAVGFQHRANAHSTKPNIKDNTKDSTKDNTKYSGFPFCDFSSFSFIPFSFGSHFVRFVKFETLETVHE